MSFVANSKNIAASAMNGIDSRLVDKFTSVIQFLSQSPDNATALRGNNQPAIGTDGYIISLAKKFAEGRSPKVPKPPNTVPDKLVSLILHRYFDIPESRLEQIKREHLLSMGAENLVGVVLEHYIASVLEAHGWIWCSGETVRAIDFIKPPSNSVPYWRLLQVKNRDNSENSSSSAIRNGTKIEKWLRTFSRKTATNWDAFPDDTLRPYLSESAFQQFATDYLNNLKL